MTDFTRFVIEHLRNEIVSYYGKHTGLDFYIPLMDIFRDGIKEDISDKDFQMMGNLHQHIVMNVDFKFIHFIFTGIQIKEDVEESIYPFHPYVSPEEFLERNYEEIVGENTFLTYLCFENYVRNYFKQFLNPKGKYNYFLRNIIYWYLNEINFEKFWVGYSCVLKTKPALQVVENV